MKISGIKTKEFQENVFFYALFFIFAAVTPFIAKPIAVLFDGWKLTQWAEEGGLRGLFEQVLTFIFWAIEYLILWLILNKKQAGDKENVSSLSPALAEAATADATDKAAKKKAKKERALALNKRIGFEKKSELLPIKNLAILTGIVAVCILILSMQIDFQVKPFYDIGEKVSTTGLAVKGSIILGNAIKCIWPTLLLKTAYKASSALMGSFTTLSEKQSTLLTWLLTGAALLVYGVYDVLVTANPFAWTYLLFYVAFTFVYYFAKQDDVKACWLIILIYLF